MLLHFMNVICDLEALLPATWNLYICFLTRYVPDRYDIDNTDYFAFKSVFGTAGLR